MKIFPRRPDEGFQLRLIPSIGPRFSTVKAMVTILSPNPTYMPVTINRIDAAIIAKTETNIAMSANGSMRIAINNCETFGFFPASRNLDATILATKISYHDSENGGNDQLRGDKRKELVCDSVAPDFK